MKTNILILGAGVYQVPLIAKAKELGLRTVVATRAGNYPGIPFADDFVDADTTDIEAILRVAREHAVAGVVTTGTDVCLPALGRVVDELGLPGTGYAAACRSMNKVLMKRAFAEHGVPTARFREFKEAADAKRFADQLGYPIMVKATDSSGSRGITKVDTPVQFMAAWERAYAVSHNAQILVEEFLSGVEFGAQAFIHGDRVVAVFPHGDTVTPAPYFTPIGHSMPTQLTVKQQQETAAVIELAVRALGMRDCISNVDLMLVDGSPKVIEIGARMGATCLPENIAIYSGMDVYGHLIRLALGEHPPVSIIARQANASLLLTSRKTGVIQALNVPPEVVSHPALVDLHWDVGVGDSVKAFQVGPDRIGHLIVKSGTAEAGEHLVQELAGAIEIDVLEA